MVRRHAQLQPIVNDVPVNARDRGRRYLVNAGPQNCCTTPVQRLPLRRRGDVRQPAGRRTTYGFRLIRLATATATTSSAAPSRSAPALHRRHPRATTTASGSVPNDSARPRGLAGQASSTRPARPAGTSSRSSPARRSPSTSAQLSQGLRPRAVRRHRRRRSTSSAERQDLTELAAVGIGRRRGQHPGASATDGRREDRRPRPRRCRLDRSSRRGSTRRGSTRRGSMRRGSTRRGSMRRGSTRRGSTRPTPTRRTSPPTRPSATPSPRAQDQTLLVASSVNTGPRRRARQRPPPATPSASFYVRVQGHDDKVFDAARALPPRPRRQRRRGLRAASTRTPARPPCRRSPAQVRDRDRHRHQQAARARGRRTSRRALRRLHGLAGRPGRPTPTASSSTSHDSDRVNALQDQVVRQRQRCPYATNLVADAIKDIIDALPRSRHPEVRRHRRRRRRHPVLPLPRHLRARRRRASSPRRCSRTPPRAPASTAGPGAQPGRLRLAHRR